MNDVHSKVLGLLAIAAALMGAVLPELGVDPRVAAELTQIAASVLAILAFYLKVSPDLPIPEAWQELIGRVTGAIGTGLVFLPAVCTMLGFDGGTAAKIGRVVGVGLGVLGAYAAKSPKEKQLASLAALRSPSALPILLLFVVVSSSACAGISVHKESLSERCAALDGQHQLWTAIVLGSGAAAGASGLSSLPVRTDTGKDVLAVASVGASILGGVALYMQNSTVQQYGEFCEVTTSTKAARP